MTTGVCCTHEFALPCVVDRYKTALVTGLVFVHPTSTVFPSTEHEMHLYEALDDGVLTLDHVEPESVDISKAPLLMAYITVPSPDMATADKTVVVVRGVLHVLLVYLRTLVDE